jgi:DNA-binding NarL/FixJ family response regulator
VELIAMSVPQLAENGVGLLLSDDFLFGSRITGTAASLGLAIKTARNTEALQALVRQGSPRCVLIDLSNPGLNIEQLAQSLRALVPAPFLVAFGSHVDTATLKAARDAGCGVVLPRSKFVEELPEKLAEWFQG